MDHKPVCGDWWLDSDGDLCTITDEGDHAYLDKDGRFILLRNTEPDVQVQVPPPVCVAQREEAADV